MAIIVIAHNIRSTYNVGSILRTADGFGVARVYLTGYTPYPPQGKHDIRLPHEQAKLMRQIHKTALGAEKTVPVEYTADPLPLLSLLKARQYQCLALEQHSGAIMLPNFVPQADTALLLGEEVNGIDPELLKACDAIVEIPMKGKKESFNVSVATGIALYELAIRAAHRP